MRLLQIPTLTLSLAACDDRAVQQDGPEPTPAITAPDFSDTNGNPCEALLAQAEEALASTQIALSQCTEQLGICSRIYRTDGGIRVGWNNGDEAAQHIGNTFALECLTEEIIQCHDYRRDINGDKSEIPHSSDDPDTVGIEPSSAFCAVIDKEEALFTLHGSMGITDAHDLAIGITPGGPVNPSAYTQLFIDSNREVNYLLASGETGLCENITPKDVEEIIQQLNEAIGAASSEAGCADY